ncbi:hypothetical protein L0Y65_03735 [Candidatus Micrarchaeota archaeon]|nr:hypothetical protein [Candidatus Micrarchaeota archaeon]
MKLRGFFDKSRREDIRRALVKGGMDALFRRIKPASDLGGAVEFEKSARLPPGMAVEVVSFKFRFMGTSGNSAIVALEFPEGGGQRLSVNIGESKNFSCHSDKAAALFQFCLTAREAPDRSGGSFVMVDVKVREVKSS